jgi:hypothetical protein
LVLDGILWGQREGVRCLMDSEASKVNAGTTSVVLASCMMCVHLVFFVLVLLPERRQPGSLLAIGPAIGLASCFSLLALPLPLILGIVGLLRGGRQRSWGLLGLALTAFALLVGFLAQAKNWKQ